MAKRKRKNNKNKSKQIILYAVAILVICILFFQSNVNLSLGENLSRFFSHASVSDATSFKPDNTGKFLLYAIDTGNSDSFLLIAPGGQSMLVDAAEDDDYTSIDSVLEKYNVQKLTAVVATHPHDDHIGSMDEVISDVGADTIYLSDYSMNTQSYKDLENAIQSSGTSVQQVVSGIEFGLGEASVTVMNPQNKEYEDANNSSIVLMVSYGESDFLLTGDIEEEAISDIIEVFGDDLDCDVLKVAHHGSRTSTTNEFLQLTSPDFAIIPCGKDNDYGHPHAETLDLLSVYNAAVLRTDQDGDIAILSDGKTIETYTQIAQ